jgi:hypothetical protein
MFSQVMKIGFIWLILGTQCDWHPKFPGQEESEGVLKLGKS